MSNMTTFEDALEKTGWGLYNYGIIIMCGFCFMAEGSLTASLSNILPLSVKELSPLDTSLFPYYTAHTVGMAVGGVLGGVALDASGRRCAVPFALMMSFTGASIWAFAGSKEFLLCAMIVLGAGLGMHTIAARIYLTEAMPAAGRGARTALLSIFWAIGFFCSTALQMVLSPSAEQKPHNFRPASWRVVVSISACFAVMVACTCGALVPSARWMVARRRPEAAVEQLRQMYAINKSRHADTFEIPRLKGCVREFPDSWRLRDDTPFCKFVWSRVGQQIAACFKKPYSVVTVVACIVRIPILNGMWTEAYWIISMMRTPCYSGKPINHMDSLVHTSNYTMVVKPEIYHDVMILAAVLIIALTLILFTVDCIGHRIVLFIFLAWSAGGMGILLIKIPMEKVLEGMCFLFFGSVINAEIAFSVISMEVYPTHIRGTANGIIPVLGRAAAIVMQLLIYQGFCFYAALGLIGFFVVAMCLVWRLPGLTKQPMHEEVKSMSDRAVGTAGEEAAAVAAVAAAARDAQPPPPEDPPPAPAVDQNANMTAAFSFAPMPAPAVAPAADLQPGPAAGAGGIEPGAQSGGEGGGGGVEGGGGGGGGGGFGGGGGASLVASELLMMAHFNALKRARREHARRQQRPHYGMLGSDASSGDSLRVRPLWRSGRTRYLDTLADPSTPKNTSKGLSTSQSTPATAAKPHSSHKHPSKDRRRHPTRDGSKSQSTTAVPRDEKPPRGAVRRRAETIIHMGPEQPKAHSRPKERSETRIQIGDGTALPGVVVKEGNVKKRKTRKTRHDKVTSRSSEERVAQLQKTRTASKQPLDNVTPPELSTQSESQVPTFPNGSGE